MTKLLVNAPSGKQELIEVAASGGYFENSSIVWDERKDGPLPTITVGGMVRQDGVLGFDATRMTQHNVAYVPEKIAETKAEAQRRIFALVPQWRQNNLIARAVELHQKSISGMALTQAEQAELTASFALWGRVKAIRAASDLIEQDVQASTDPASFNVAISPRWPA